MLQVGETKTDGWTDGQTDRETGRYIDTQTNR
jgi:hypothetical protein